MLRLLILAALLGDQGALESTPRGHPFLFTSSADVARARAAVATGEPFSTWARELVHAAVQQDAASLPRLEREWWERDRDKPWSETYPQIFHHTWIVPSRWADLARRCARGSLLSPEAGLAEKGKRILLALADYTFEFRHYDVGMNYTVWGIEALDAYDILHDSMGAPERERVDSFFRRMLGAVRENDRYWVEHEPGGPLNNHYAWHKLGMAAFGLFYGQGELVEEALHGPKGVDTLMDHGFSDDGLWIEGSIPYQLAATAALLDIAEILENAGYPTKLYRRESGDDRTLEGAYGALMGLLLPDGTLPPIGDAYGLRPHLGTHRDWETLCRRLGDPRFAWLLRDLGQRSNHALFEGVPVLPPAEPPSQPSRLWPEHGYAALRSAEGPSYWQGAGWSLFTTYGSNPVHSNADKLSILLYGGGRLWLPDCEARTSAEHSFSARIQRELNRETICHNTLLVDGRSQRHPDRRLDLVEYQVLPEVKRVSIGDLDGRLYPGVRQLRTCVVRDEYVLDFLQVHSTEEHDLSWIIHVDGVLASTSVGEGTSTELPGGPPWSYLRTPKVAPILGHVAERYQAGRDPSKCASVFAVDLWTDGPADLLSCGFPRDDGDEPATIPMRLLRSRKASAWYAAVYRIAHGSRETTGESFQPLDVQVEPGPVESWKVKVGLGGKTLEHRVPRLGAWR